MQAVPTPVLDAAEIERAMTEFGQQPDGALFVVPDVFVQVHRELIIRLADKYRLPAVYPYRFFASSGGLMSYGLDTVAVFRQAASYVDRSQRRQAGRSAGAGTERFSSWSSI